MLLDSKLKKEYQNIISSYLFTLHAARFQTMQYDIGKEYTVEFTLHAARFQTLSHEF